MPNNLVRWKSMSRGPKAMERNCDYSFCPAPIHLRLATFPIIPGQPSPDILSIQVLPLELAPHPSLDLRPGESDHRLPLDTGQTSDPAGLWDVSQFHWGYGRERRMCSFLMDLNQGQEGTKEGSQQSGQKPVLFALEPVKVGLLTLLSHQCEGALCGWSILSERVVA